MLVCSSIVTIMPAAAVLAHPQWLLFSTAAVAILQLCQARSTCMSRGLACKHGAASCRVVWSWQDEPQDCLYPACNFLRYVAAIPSAECTMLLNTWAPVYHRRSLKQTLAPFQAPPFVQVPAAPVPSPPVVTTTTPTSTTTTTTTNPSFFPFANPCTNANTNINAGTGFAQFTIPCFFPFQQPSTSVASPTPSPN